MNIGEQTMNHPAWQPNLVWNWSSQETAPTNEEGTLVALLAGIAETGSVARVARDLGYSYRHVWGLIRTWEGRFQQPLVDMSRGKGSSLAPLGLHLVRLDARLKSRFAPALASAATEARRELATFFSATPSRLTLHASHDPLLARLPSSLRAQGIELNLHVLGSSDGLTSLAAGHCDLAGFHCPQGELAAPIWASYRNYLDPEKHVLIRFARRSQGLMVAASNPQQIGELGDLTRSGVRFVNRQAGSGTRLLFDLLLMERSIEPQKIAGYEVEEFTHAAVAAIIASGGADAGLGVSAAAERFGLRFIPLVYEDYYLACRRHLLERPALQTLLDTLASPDWQAKLKLEAGYEAIVGETVIECENAWGTDKKPRKLKGQAQ
ncbi:MAG: bacterial regulatory helix-turn-helix, lysR family protein [Proteobacteria bacterium]|nr:bacterial regulatory helix-turn-helix, lysR family protein [Pseudomonadota bacterium]